MKKYSFFEHKMNNRNQRLANKKSSNLKLISSTIKNLSKKGINELTMHDVSSGAGLSQGIVNFHFKSKEILLIETLKFISNEYLKSSTAHNLGETVIDDYSINSNDNLHGVYTRYYKNGQIDTQGSYVNGLRRGFWEYFDLNGGLLGQRDSDNLGYEK